MHHGIERSENVFDERSIMIDVRMLNSEADWRASYPIMRQLRPHLSEDEYLRLVAVQYQTEAYRLVAAIDKTVMRAVAGLRIATSLIYGRHVYVNDLVSDESNRSKGYGKLLIDWIAQFARDQNCGDLVLDSGVQRCAAHRFCLRERMDIKAFHFVRSVKD